MATAPLIIHGAAMSSCTRRVVLVCKELGVPYQLKTVEFSKFKAPEHLALQPFGQVPVLEEDGFFLYESRAISRYIVAKYGKGSTLVPQSSDLRATALFEAACSIEQANFDKFAMDICFEQLVKKTPMWKGPPTDEARVTQLLAGLSQKLDGYERILSKQRYLAGDTVTLADLFHLSAGYKLELEGKFDILQQRPHVARWWNELKSRPTWQSTVS